MQESLQLRVSREVAMDNWTFGITMLVVGMGGTLVALGILALMMGLLKKIFPLKEESSN
jgi:hypothetical protein